MPSAVVTAISKRKRKDDQIIQAAWTKRPYSRFTGVESPKGLCTLCRVYGILNALRYWMHGSKFEPSQSGKFPGFCDYGKPADLKSRTGCTFCVLIWQLVPSDLVLPFEANVVIDITGVQQNPNGSSRDVNTANGALEDDDQAINHLGSSPTRLQVLLLESDARPKFVEQKLERRQHIPLGFIELNLNEYSTVLKGPLTTKSLEPPTLDFQKIKQLLKSCETCHSHCLNESASRHRPPIDILLLDVKSGRLVNANSGFRYLALSYVWGEAQVFSTTQGNRRSLQEQGGIFGIQTQLPQTVRDAISLTEKVGECFLWVDALCIEQDNAEQKHSQISQMDVIYSHSLLTLVAWTAKDANSALAGVRPGTLRVPSLEREIGGTRLRTNPFHFEYLRSQQRVSRYDSRAWTFQERLLSPRCLFMAYHDAFFVCNSENPSAINNQIISEDPSFNSLSMMGSDSQKLYVSLVEDFNEMETSNQKDKLNAFAGILATLRPKLGECLQGIPLAALDVCLLWIPERGFTVTRNPAFSSWSWAGWSGRIKFMQEDCNIEPEIEKLEWSYQTPKRVLPRGDSARTNGGLGLGSPDSRMGIDVLHFQAWTVRPPRIFITKFLTNALIMTSSNRQCGLLYGLDHNSVSELSKKMNWVIVLLSRQVTVGESKLITEIPLQLNVMLVRWVEDTAERVAVGVMNQAFWDNASPVKDYVRLG